MKDFAGNLLFFLLALIITSCDKEVSTTESDQPIFNGKIFVQTDPPGASIYINGDNSGKVTPDSITHLEYGEYNVELRMKLFLDTLITVDVHEDREEVVYINYMNSPHNFGEIICDSQPTNSLIILDDSSTGAYTPSILSFIWPGKHKIKLIKPEHRADSTEITVYAGQDNRVSMLLQDTSEVIHYTPLNSGIPTSMLTSVAVDNDNVVWCGSYIGLIKFEEPNWTVYNAGNSTIPASFVTTIQVDSQNRKWIGTNKGLLVINDNEWIVYTSENSDLPLNYIREISFDKKGNTWLQASDMSTPGYLVKFDGTNWYSYTPDRTFLSFAIDDNDVVWVGTTWGMRQLIDGEWFSDYQYSTDSATVSSFNTGAINEIKIDKDGTLWFVIEIDYHGSCRIFSLKNNLVTEHFTEISYPHINDMYISPLGIKWFTTHYFQWGDIIKIIPDGESSIYNANTWNWDLYFFNNITGNNKGDLYIASVLHGLIKFKGFDLN